MTTPSVSILMAAYNAEDYLAEAIDSLLSQTFFDFELVVVNDGSSDDSAKILESFANADRRVRCITNEKNLGFVASLNKGLLECRSQLVARADADDVFYPERLQTQLDYMNAYPAVGVLGTGVEFINADGTRNPRRLQDLPLSPEAVRLHSLLGCSLWHTTVVFRRQLVIEAGGYSKEMVGGPEDYELWSRLAGSTKIANLSDVLCKVRLHSSSITANWENGFELFCSVARRLQEEFLQEKVESENCRSLVILCGSGGDLTRINLAGGIDLLNQILQVADETVNSAATAHFRRKAASTLLRNAATIVYTNPSLAKLILKAAARTDWRLMFSRQYGATHARLSVPASVRSLFKSLAN